MNVKLSPGPDGPETTELVRRAYLDVMADLPTYCFVRHITTGEPIIVKRGHQGYFPVSYVCNVERMNGERGLTAAQISAMEVGSIVGFNCPGADPLNYPEDANASSYDAKLIAQWAKRESNDG